MLRVVLVFLLLANGFYWLWSEGSLRGFGYGPALQREPQRVAQQIQPEAVQLLSSTDLKRVEAQVKADMAPRQCLQAGPLDEAGWSLLVANSAAAAKLRQMLPQLQAELQHHGKPVAEIRLRVRRGRA